MRAGRPDTGRRILTAVAAGVVAACTALLPAPGAAQDRPATAEPLRVRLSTVGTFGNVRPYAEVTTSEPAYVAVFEVEPDIGAVMLWPYTDGRSRFLTSGRGRVELWGTRPALYRREFRDHLRYRFQMASHVRPEAYLVAVASRRPLDLAHLEAGRIFRYAAGFGSGYEVARSLVDLVAVGPRPDWDYEVVSFVKGRDPSLSLALTRYGLYRSAYRSPCVAAGQLGFYTGLGLYSTPWIGCGPVFYGPTSWWYPTGGDNLAMGPGQAPGKGSGFARTDSMSVGHPQARDRPRVTAGDPVPADGRLKEMSPEQVRRILQEVADARTAAPVDPNVLVRRRRAFERAGVSDPSGVSLQMTAQGIAASKRLESRLRRMGLTAGQAREAASRPGAAPRVHFSGGHAAVRAPSRAAWPRTGVSRSTPGRARSPSHAAPQRRRSRSSASRPGHVSRPSASRAPRRNPVRRSRPESSSRRKGGGGGGSSSGSR